MEILGYFGALLIGLILGIIGSGGSVLAVPIFTYFFLLDEKIATAYSLFVVGSTSLVGGVNYKIKKLVNWNQVLLFGLPSIISVVFVRYYIIPDIPDIILSISGVDISRRILILGLFSILLILSSIIMFINKHNKPTRSSLNYFKITSEGFLVGALTGLIGAGGGFLIIPSLVILGKLPMKEAVGTSLVIISLKSLSGFFFGDAFLYQIDWILILRFTFISILGILLGNYLSVFINAKLLKKIFAVFIFVVGFLIITTELLNLIT
ncbi:sulfite exporter TauE/SafE family protein [Flavobacteriaceae bacterium]|nr:sulfite exporter TauE/SafE family protein [Flavobacteriaceae bacterium]